MTVHSDTACVAFEGFRRIATGKLSHVAGKVRKALDRGERAPLLIFAAETGEQIDLDLRGSVAEVTARLPSPPPEQTEVRNRSEASPRSAGRPRLGVVAREVTLLPQHWDWLGRQPGGASVAIRKLVHEASRASADKDRLRSLQEAAYRFMSAIAGNLPDFEEATRALFAGNAGKFAESTESWPKDIREHARQMAERAFANPSAA